MIGLVFIALFFSSAALTTLAVQWEMEPWSVVMKWLTDHVLDPPPTVVATPGQWPAPAPTSIDFNIFPLTVRKIALDPGHGGEDGGATIPQGLVEKEVTLDIARRLRRLLVQHAFEVLMTRDSDETVSLAQRAARANAGRADLLVSIHANWFKSAEARGAETYYHGPTKDPHILQLVALENRPSGYSLGEYRQLLETVYLDVRRAQSHLLARALQQALHRLHRSGPVPQTPPGVKMAPFLVLVGSNMPAVLTEVAYLSNPEEAQWLATPEYRQRLAEALLQGIRAYVATLNNSTKKGS
jgi:N-acetylmuramoyl-L-alanine amidase